MAGTARASPSDQGARGAASLAPLELVGRARVAGRNPRQRLLTLAQEPPLAGRQAIQAQARGDRIEPRRELRIAAEVRDGPVSPQKYLLRRLLGLGSAAEHPERDAEHAVLVGDHQLLEGSRVAPS